MADLRFSGKAIADLRSFDNFLRPRSPKAADALLAEVETLCGLVSVFPQIGRMIPGTALRYMITRKYRYRIIYRIGAEGIEVMAIMHPRQA